MLFADDDPVAIHTLVCVGWQVLRDLCEKRDTVRHKALKALIRPGMEREFWRGMNSAANFFKHADRDPDEILEVDPTYGTNLARCLATAPVRLPSFLLSS
jgi:hypothetical protein